MPDLTTSSAVDTFMQSVDQAAMRSAIGVTFTQPTGASLIQSGGFPVTLTATGSTSIALPTSGTLASTADKLSAFAATTSDELRGVISNETGTGSLVFATSPTLVTPNIGVASATSVNKVLITAPATSATLTITNGSSLTASGNVTLASSGTMTLTLGANNITLSTSGATAVTLPVSGTLATLSGSETLSNKTLSGCELGAPISGVLTNCTDYPVSALANAGTGVNTFLATPSSANLRAAVTDETGTGSLVFANTPTLITPNIGAAIGASLAVSGALTSSGGNIGFTAGAGETVTQATSSTTSVTINARCGMVQMNASVSIAPENKAVFQVDNNTVAQSDVVILSIRGGTNGGNTQASVVEVGAGYFKICVSNNNNSSGGTTETGTAIQINFAVFKATTSSTPPS
jgi:hypothetical protein